jgi:hypothetical protein
VTGSSTLQVALIWRGKLIGYRLLDRQEQLTIGPAPGTTFATAPVLPGRRHGRFPLVAPAKAAAGRHRLRLTSLISGEIVVGGQTKTVAEVIAGTPTIDRQGHVHEIEIGAGDKARLGFTEADGLRLEIRYVDRPPVIPRPRLSDTEPLLAQITALTAMTLFLVVAAALVFAPDDGPPTLAISAERRAKILPPQAPPPPPPPAPKKAEEKEKEKEKESGQMTKAKEEKGRLGRQDALVKDTVIPKGEKDILREKVSKVGLLGIIGKERPQGSGLTKLFANESNEMEQAIAGMAGAKLAVGRGEGGLTTTGTGMGGGGTGNGHIYGAGDIDTGGRSSRGRGKGPSLTGRKEREVKLEVAAGSIDDGGGLSKEQVARVVRAHQNAIKFCYEKELQRKPTLGGKIEAYWVILPDGSVEKSKIAVTTMEDTAVEGCIVRQVKQWVFPKSDGRTVVQSYPFLFKGGV